MDNKKYLGKRIKEVRKAKGITQEKLAEIIGIETGSLSAIESGRHFPSLITLEKIAQHFDVELQIFFDFSNYFSEAELIEKTIQNISQMKLHDVYRIYRCTEFYKGD